MIGTHVSLSISASLWLAFSACMGLAVGSFINVVVCRLPYGLSIARPRSRCPRCFRTIRWYENLPVVSWLWLRAHCRGCGAYISARYPMVEAATGLIFVAIGQYAASLPMVIGGWWFAGSLIALALIDLDHFVLPDTLTLPLIPLGLGIRYLSGSPPSAVWLVDVLAVPLLLLGVRALYLRLRGIEGLGLGDVKLMASIGALMGVSGAIGALLVGSTLAAVAGLSAVALGRAGLRSRLPFGPFLIFGAMAWQAAIWAGALPPGLGPGL